MDEASINEDLVNIDKAKPDNIDEDEPEENDENNKMDKDESKEVTLDNDKNMIREAMAEMQKTIIESVLSEVLKNNKEDKSIDEDRIVDSINSKIFADLESKRDSITTKIDKAKIEEINNENNHVGNTS